jgi:hypothetical protein
MISKDALDRIAKIRNPLFRQHTAAALADWQRVPADSPEPNIKYQQQLIRSAISEILSLRLQAAYAPIFGTLKRMELQMAVLAESGRAPFAPPAVRPAMPSMPKYDLPEFLRPERSAVTAGD